VLGVGELLLSSVYVYVGWLRWLGCSGSDGSLAGIGQTQSGIWVTCVMVVVVVMSVSVCSIVRVVGLAWLCRLRRVVKRSKRVAFWCVGGVSFVVHM